MTAAIIDIQLEQGIPRSVIVANWRNEQGELIPLAGSAAKFQLRTSIESDAPLLELSTEAGGGITIRNDDGVESLVATFTKEQTAALKPIEPRKATGGLPNVAPAFLVGVYELRIDHPVHRPCSVLRGMLNIVLAVVRT